MFISVSSWLSPHLNLSFEALLVSLFLFSSIKSLLMAKATPILLEYCPLVIILILGTFASICSASSSVVLASWTARIAIRWSLIIRAIWGHFELWALSFFPLIFQDASVIPFFFPSLDWNCFLTSWCFSMLTSSRSVSSVDGSVSLQKGLLFSWSKSGFSWLESVVSKFVGEVVLFLVLVFMGLVLSGMIMFILRWLVSFIPLGILCLSARVPRLGTFDKSVGVARFRLSISPFCPLAC